MKMIIPKCTNGDIAMITNESRWMPCCNFSSRQAKNTDVVDLFKSPDYHLDSVRSTDEFHRLPSFVSWLDSLRADYDSAPEICKINCALRDSVDGLNTYNHRMATVKTARDIRELMAGLNEKADG